KNVIINNNVSANAYAQNYVFAGKPKNKWISLLLCIFTVCGHKFYEGKIGMGILYLFTFGLFGIGLFIDIISLIMKPNPYYV
ncbi:MAG: TM2 domain-containing protein, partial [Acetivibrio ethanolgignens]